MEKSTAESVKCKSNSVIANKIMVSGETETYVGAKGFSQTVSFETGKDAMYLICIPTIEKM